MHSHGFRGGIRPHDHKESTRDKHTARLPVPRRIVVPVVQHLGVPNAPVVAVGDTVRRGQLIASAGDVVSAPVHSPVTGVVVSIGDTLTINGAIVSAVHIEPDQHQEWDDYVRVEVTSVVRTVRAAGVVGLGGGAFPTAVKLSPPADSPVSTLIVNGCECEPYLTCDHRTMLERPASVASGAHHIASALGASCVVVGIEANKPDAVDVMRSAMGASAEVLMLATRYPQGAEKQLIHTVLGREVPHGNLPASVGALVHNVSTAAAIADALDEGKPLIERVVTVTGQVARPGNYIVPIGMLVSDLLEAVGGVTEGAGRVVAGGPMTGIALANLDVPIVKGTGGIVVLPARSVAPAIRGDQPCIRCARCVAGCPMSLEPYALGIYANRRQWDTVDSLHAMDCIECGCCAYVCPTNRPLVQLIRRAKQVLIERVANS